MKLPIVTALILAVGAVVLWQHQQNERLKAQIADVRGQIVEAATLREKDGQSINQLKKSLLAEAERTRSERDELMPLRAQATRLRQSEQENAQLKTERNRLAKNVGQSAVGETKAADEQSTPEQKLRHDKGLFARNLGTALRMISFENDEHLPTKLPEVVEFMLGVASQGDVRLDQFELAYKGSLRDVKDPENLIVAREKVPMQLANGEWVRAYAFAYGRGETITATTRDGFAAKEKEFRKRESNP